MEPTSAPISDGSPPRRPHHFAIDSLQTQRLPGELLYVLRLLQRTPAPTPLRIQREFDGESLGDGVDQPTLRIVFCQQPRWESQIGGTDGRSSTAGDVVVVSDWHQGRLARPVTPEGVQRYYWYQWPQLLDQILPLGDAEGEIGQGAVLLLSEATELREIFASLAEDAGYSGWASPIDAALPACNPHLVLIDGMLETSNRGNETLSGSISGLVADGLTVTISRVRTAYSNAPIIVMEDFPRWVQAEQLFAAGASAVCGKPVAVFGLLSLIRRVDLSLLLSSAAPQVNRQRTIC